MSRAFLLLVLFCPLPTVAVSPPPAQFTADCTSPSYASDQLVCADADLLVLDRLLVERIAQPDVAEEPSDADLANLEWFSRSRQCAFVADHRECLIAAYCLRLLLVGSFDAQAQALCNPSANDFQPVSSLSNTGFVRPGSSTTDIEGQIIRIWGFVDHGNLYGDVTAKAVLGDWWSGEGSAPDRWRFSLKAADDGPVGASFAVHVPNDPLRDDLLRIFTADARQGKATKVFVQGKLMLFDAPTGGSQLTGLRLELESASAIRLERLTVAP